MTAPSAARSAAAEEPARERALRSWSAKLVELVRARELLAQLVKKELKVRYKNSTLGFLWSMLTPALMTAVFTVVFTLIAGIEVADFPAFFVSGYLLWQFFQNSCQGAIHSIVGNGDLVKKVYFPREVLPLSHVLAQLVHLVLALVVFSPYLVWTRGVDVLTYLPVTLAAIAVLTIFTSGAAMWFAGVNVVFRDLQELFVVIFQVWFYATPVIYPLALVHGVLPDRFAWIATALEFNPMTWFVEVVRHGLYGPVSAVARGDRIVPIDGAPGLPDLSGLGIAAAWAVASFVIGYVVFQRRARTFAKEV